MSKRHDMLDVSTKRKRGPSDDWAERCLGVEPQPDEYVFPWEVMDTFVTMVNFKQRTMHKVRCKLCGFKRKMTPAQLSAAKCAHIKRCGNCPRPRNNRASAAQAAE